MSSSTETKDDSASAPAPNETHQDANPRAVKTFQNNERGPRSSQSSDYNERRKFNNNNNDRNSSRGWRGGHNKSRYGSRGGYNDRRRGGGYSNRGRYNEWRHGRRSGGDLEPEYSDTNVYVANLPEDWDDKKLASIFVEFGEIESAAIMHTNREDRQRIAFVNFNEPECAAKTISELHGKPFEGLPDPERGLIVKKAYLKRNGNNQNSRNGERRNVRYDRNSSNGSMPGFSQGANGTNGMNHNKNIHNQPRNSQSSNNRRPPSGPLMGHQTQVNQPRNSQTSFPPPNVDSRNQMPHSSDGDQLATQMGSNWGPNSVPDRGHHRNPPSGRSFQGMQQQQPRSSGHSNQQPPPQHQQQFMMHVVPQMQQMPQNYPYMLDQQGNPMQMQVVDQNGNMVPVMFPSQAMQQPQMQLVNMPGPNGEWVQAYVPQTHQVQMQQQMPMQHIETQQTAQIMHGEVPQQNLMYEMPHDQMNPYAMPQQQQQMHHAQPQYNPEMRSNPSTQPPPGFQNGHVHEQMRQMPPQGHQFTASPRMNFGYPSSSQVYPSSAVGLPVYPESSQADANSSSHLE